MDGTASAIMLRVNGEQRALWVDHRAALLDVLREQLDLTGTLGPAGAKGLGEIGLRSDYCILSPERGHGVPITAICPQIAGWG